MKAFLAGGIILTILAVVLLISGVIVGDERNLIFGMAYFILGGGLITGFLLDRRAPEMEAEEWMTFDQVIAHLSIDKHKLNRLVSRGKIRAYREKNTMKFKRSEIITLNDFGENQATEILTENLVFGD